MAYLEGHQVKIDTPSLKDLIGRKVNYLLKRDIDHSGRGYFKSFPGTITEIYRKHIDFGNGELVSFSQVKEITIEF